MKHSWFTIQKVKPDIYGIAEFAHEEEVISYLIIGKEYALLIDTGLGIHALKPIVSQLTDFPIVATHTHHHWDHIGGDHEFECWLDAQSIGTIDCAPYHFEIIPCPGHSPDSIALWEPRYGYLFIGDTLYDGPLYLQLPESNMHAFAASLSKLRRLTNINHIFPSHNTFSFEVTAIDLVNDVVEQYLQTPERYAGLSEIPIKGRLRLKIA